MPTLPPQLRQAAQRLAGARHVAVLTGAGISAESGIPTFRSSATFAGEPGASAAADTSMAALWASFDPAKLATPQAFAADPATVTRWYDHRRLGCLAAQPNAGHTALARLERRLADRGGSLTILTQNVDRLHQRAGSTAVIELHGSIIVWRCTQTGQRATPPPEPLASFPPPSPFHQGAVLRPDVVWFGEMLPARALQAAGDAAERCDLFLSVGTSSVVYPAAGFIDLAIQRGVPTLEINPQPTPYSPRVTHALAGPAGQILPALLAAAFPGHDPANPHS